MVNTASPLTLREELDGSEGVMTVLVDLGYDIDVGWCGDVS